MVKCEQAAKAGQLAASALGRSKACLCLSRVRRAERHTPCIRQVHEMQLLAAESRQASTIRIASMLAVFELVCSLLTVLKAAFKQTPQGRHRTETALEVVELIWASMLSKLTPVAW